MDFAKLWHWHEQPGLIAWAQTRAGRALLWILAVVLISKLGSAHIVPTVVALALPVIMIRPQNKRVILSVAALAMLFNGFLKPQGLNLNDPLALVAGIGAASPGLLTVKFILALTLLFLTWLALRYIKWWPAPLRRHPVLLIHIGLWLGLYLGQLWQVAIVGQAAFLIWRMSYLAQYAQQGGLANTRFQDHLFYLMPAYGGSATPFGKGLRYLTRFEATDSQALAKSQLAGLKLWLLAAAWVLLIEALEVLLMGRSSHLIPLTLPFASPELPPLSDVVAGNPATLSWLQAWSVLALNLLFRVLKLAIAGHVAVGCLRLFGFNVFRNTYKPLLATSIVDYWGRFYFYFKEILVDFFFYPAYLRLKSLSPASRLFWAVFAAAFAGNIYHHLFYSSELILTGDIAGLWAKWGARTIYCALLALGIWISMLRRQKNQGAVKTIGFWTRLRKMAGVWLFFALIQIWNLKSTESGTVDAFRFFFRLFGIT